ncbi:MAG: HSP20 family protein [Gammaproteobacteria bacterium]|jgi:HSP20 family protein
MSSLDQLRKGLTRAWDSVTEGWHELVERAGDALTRFHPQHTDSEVETSEERIAHRSTRWGVLAAEVKVDSDEVAVDIEVPGMDAGDFEIRVVDDVLVVHGEKKVSRERTAGQFHIMERAYGVFERAVRLPVPVDETAAKASYERGVLHIALQRSAAHKARRIEVKRA